MRLRRRVGGGLWNGKRRHGAGLDAHDARSCILYATDNQLERQRMKAASAVYASAGASSCSSDSQRYGHDHR